MACVYSITNTVTKKLYIGSTICLVRKRWNTHKNHLRKNKHANSKLQNSWNKHGEESFEFKVLEKCEDLSARELEKAYVDRLKPHFNLIPVGALPSRKRFISEAQKQQLRSRFKGVPLSEEHRQKIAKAITGFKHSEEARRKMSEKKKGKKCPESKKQALRNKPRKDAFWSFNGETRRLSDWAKMCGVDAHTLRTRIRNKWPSDQVLRPKTFSRRPIPKVFLNGAFRTVKECSQITGVKPSIVYERLKLGWKPEEAVSIPKGGKR